MSLPPREAPLVYGWPWHGKIRQDPSQTARQVGTLLLPSGATMEVEWFATSTHLFDPGMPAVGLPAEGDRELWSRGIRRGGNERGDTWFWDGRRGNFIGCVVAGRHWQDQLTMSITGASIRIYVQRKEPPYGRYGETYLPLVTVLGMPAGTNVSNASVQVIGWGPAGDRALVKVYLHFTQFRGPHGLCGILEVRYDPVAETTQVVVLADYQQCYAGQVLSRQDSQAPERYTRWRTTDGSDLVLPAGQDPGPGYDPLYDQLWTWAVGTYHAQVSYEFVVHAWYSPAGEVALVTAGIDQTLTEVGTGENEGGSSTAEATYSLNGTPLVTTRLERTTVFLGDQFGQRQLEAQQTGTLYVDGVQEAVSQWVNYDTRYDRPIPLSIYSDQRNADMLDYGEIRSQDLYSDVAENAVKVMVNPCRAVSNNVLGCIVYFVRGLRVLNGHPRLWGEGATGWSQVGPLIHPSGADGAVKRYLNPHLAPAADTYGVYSASYNPVTGELARDDQYRYSWV